MKVLKNKIKKISKTSRTELIKIVRDVVSYNNIYIDDKMLFSSTCFYYLKDSNDILKKESFPLKLFLPDFIMENFSLCPKEQKLQILGFIKIFLKEIIFISDFLDINKSLYLYTTSLKNDRKSIKEFICKRDLILYFANYFKQKIEIIENFPKKVLNRGQFTLGKNIINNSISKDNIHFLGEYIYTFINRVLVVCHIHSSEIENLKLFLRINGFKNLFMIFSNSNSNSNSNYYKIYFIIEKNKIVSVFSGNNYF